MNWGYVAAASGALITVMIAAIGLVTVDQGILLVAFFPLGIGFAGALGLASHESH